MRRLTQLAKREWVQNSLAKFMVVVLAAVVIFLVSDLAVPQSADAYPFWAQQTAPETPSEATGRIVCANCHLAQKPSEIEIPQAVLPDIVNNFNLIHSVIDASRPTDLGSNYLEKDNFDPHLDDQYLPWIISNVNNRYLTTGLTPSESTGLNNSIKPTRQTTPEPTANIPLIALGTLGVGSIILRKQKQKKWWCRRKLRKTK